MKTIFIFLLIAAGLFAQIDNGKNGYYYHQKNWAAQEEEESLISPSDLDSLILWNTPATIWSINAWGDTSGFNSGADPFARQAGTFAISTSANLGSGNYNFLHTNNATDTWMRTQTANPVAYANYTAWTVFFVDSIKTGGTYQQLSGITSDASNNELIFMRTDNTEHFNLFVRDIDGTSVNIISDSVATGKWMITVCQWSGVNRMARIILSGDTTSTTQGGSFLSSTTWSGYQELGIFGAWYNFTLNGGLNGGIAEIIAYRGFKTLSEINQICAYLANKYKLYWSSTF